MSREINSPNDRLIADLDTVRALVRSWGDIDEGSLEQARAISHGDEVLANLLESALAVILASPKGDT